MVPFFFLTMTIAEANGKWDGLITELSNSCLRWDLTSSYIDGGIRLYLCLIDVSTKSDLNKEQLDIGKDLILQYKDIFSKGDHDLGHTDKVRHRIDMVDALSKYPSASIELFGKMVILLQVLMTASLSLFLVNSFLFPHR
jgi:hypothetical protein